MATIPGHPPFTDGTHAHAPHLGEHTEEILSEYGYKLNEISNFLEKGSAIQYK